MPASLKRSLDQVDSPNNDVSSSIYACIFPASCAIFQNAFTRRNDFHFRTRRTRIKAYSAFDYDLGSKQT